MLAFATRWPKGLFHQYLDLSQLACKPETVIHFEREFEERLGALDRDSRQAATFAYTQAALDYLASDFAVRDRLQQHASFWNATIGAMQASAFISLGRIFDRDKGTHSAEALLDFADEHPGIFSRDALANRRVAGGMDPTQAATFAAKAYELQRGGLLHLKTEFHQREAFFQDKVAPIRHKVYAHAGKLDRAARERLFTDLFVRPLEELIVFTLRLHQSLWMLYHNGREPRLASAPTNIVDVMKDLPPPGHSTWEHLHAAKEVDAFVDWLKRCPINDHDQ